MIVKLESGSIGISILDAISLSLTHNLPKINLITNSRGKIEQVIFTEEYRIVIGESLEVKKDNVSMMYFIESISRKNEFEFTIKSTIRNKSSTFILPLIANNASKNDYMNFNSFLYNSYLQYEDADDYSLGEYLFVKYRFFNIDHYYELEKRLMALPTFVKTIQPDNNFTVYVFKIPQQFLADIKLILKGKYSRISAIAKSKIIVFHTVKITDKLSMILNNGKDLRNEMESYFGCEIPDDVDLLDKPDLNLEKL